MLVKQVPEGAAVFRRFEPDAMDPGLIVMLDPEGNEFCLD